MRSSIIAQSHVLSPGIPHQTPLLYQTVETVDGYATNDSKRAGIKIALG